MRYRLSGTAHASVQNRSMNIWYETLVFLVFPIIQADDKNKDLSITCYKVTKLGLEILTLGEFNSDDKYILNIGQVISSYVGQTYEVIKIDNTDMALQAYEIDTDGKQGKKVWLSGDDLSKKDAFKF